MTRAFDQLKLCKADSDMLDRLVDAGFELDQLDDLTQDELQRARNILAMLGFLETYPIQDASDTLIDATLARIDQYEKQRSAMMSISTPEVKTTSRGFSFPRLDMIATAAAVLLCVALVSMFVKSNRDLSIQQQCATNMAGVGSGIFNYYDLNQEMPNTSVASLASQFGGTSPERIDTNALVEGSYCKHQHLNCPGHGGDNGGFSYQTQSAASWMILQTQGGAIILMADRNPILEDLLAGGTPDPLTPSANHGPLGQNRLHDDGSTQTSVAPPVIGNDFIWQLDGNNRSIDIFLTH